MTAPLHVRDTIVVVFGGTGFMGLEFTRCLLHPSNSSGDEEGVTYNNPKKRITVSCCRRVYLCHRGQRWSEVVAMSDHQLSSLSSSSLLLSSTADVNKAELPVVTHVFVDWDSPPATRRRQLQALHDAIMEDIAALSSTNQGSDGDELNEDELGVERCRGRCPSVGWVNFSCVDADAMCDVVRYVWLPVARESAAVDHVDHTFIQVSSDSVYATTGSTVKVGDGCVDVPDLDRWIHVAFAAAEVPNTDSHRHGEETEAEGTVVTQPPPLVSKRCRDNDDESSSAEDSTSTSSSSSSSASSSSVEMNYGEEKRLAELLIERVIRHINDASVSRAPFRSSAVGRFLRLPDVIGPNDGTGRFLATVLWAVPAVLCSSTRVRLPVDARWVDCPMSIVDSRMAGSSVLCHLSHAKQHHRAGAGTAVRTMDVVHVACYPPVPTVKELIDSVAARVTQRIAAALPDLVAATAVVAVPWQEAHRTLSHETVSSNSPLTSRERWWALVLRTEETCDYYPSVDCGPMQMSDEADPLMVLPSWRTTIAETVDACWDAYQLTDVVRKVTAAPERSTLAAVPPLAAVTMRTEWRRGLAKVPKPIRDWWLNAR